MPPLKIASDSHHFWAVVAGTIALLVLIRLCRRTRNGAPRARSGTAASSFAKIGDNFKSIEQVQQALREHGVESCNLIIGVDFTRSNEWTGSKTFGGKCLHHLEPHSYDASMRSPAKLNPYQQTISIIGRTLEAFDEDRLIPAFGFGDATTKAHSVFSFFADGRPARGFAEVLQRYTEIVPSLTLSGPTSFAPLIREAIRIVREERSYHILLIVADGQVDAEADTIDAIVEASQYPLSIVMVGVGDGPFDVMEKFDDELPERQFDNFQFVNFNDIMRSEDQEATFAVQALMEVPEQYAAIKKLSLLSTLGRASAPPAAGRR